MKTSFLCLLAAALTVTAKPVASEEDKRAVENSSGCYYFADPDNCVPTVCMCANGWIYLVNEANIDAGLDGCDPPWGYIATSVDGYPGFGC